MALWHVHLLPDRAVLLPLRRLGGQGLATRVHRVIGLGTPARMGPRGVHAASKYLTLWLQAALAIAIGWLERFCAVWASRVVAVHVSGCLVVSKPNSGGPRLASMSQLTAILRR